MPGNTLTDRDLSIIYDKISELLVKELCESLVNGQDIIHVVVHMYVLKNNPIINGPMIHYVMIIVMYAKQWIRMI